MRLPNDSSFSSSGVLRSRGRCMSADRCPSSVRGAGRHDDGAPLAAHDARADEEHRRAVAEGRVVGHGGARVLRAPATLSPVSELSSTARLMVCRRRASAGTASPASSSRMSPGDEARRGDDRHLVVAADAGVGRLHLLERLERRLGAPLLEEAEERVEDDDEQDRRRVAEADEEQARPRGSRRR